MKTAVFASIPAWGHLRPLVVQGAELARRGWRVAVVTDESMRARVEAAGLTFVSITARPDAAEVKARMQASVSTEPRFALTLLALSQWALTFWEGLFDGVSHAIETLQPDIVVSDIGSFGPLEAADRAGVAAVVNNPLVLAFLETEIVPPDNTLPLLSMGGSMAAPGRGHRLTTPVVRSVLTTWVNQTFGRTLNRVRRQRGVPEWPLGSLSRHWAGRLVLVNAAFGVEYPRMVPPNVQLVGPMIEERDPPLAPEWEEWLGKGPVVLVTFGTLSLPPESFFRTVADGLSSDRFRVLWALGEPSRSQLRHVPSNVRIESWVPSIPRLLSHPALRVAVCHGGVNSSYEAIDAGVPVVSVPLFADQRDMATQLSDAGAGITLDKTRFTANELRTSIERLLDDPSYAERQALLRSCLRLAGGVRRAADLIEHVADHGVEHLMPIQQQELANRCWRAGRS